MASSPGSHQSGGSALRGQQGAAPTDADPTPATYKEHHLLVQGAPPPTLTSTHHRPCTITLALAPDGLHSPSAHQTVPPSPLSTPQATRIRALPNLASTPPSSSVRSLRSFDCVSPLAGASRLAFSSQHTSLPLTPPSTAASKRQYWGRTGSASSPSGPSVFPTPCHPHSLRVDSSGPRGGRIQAESPTLHTRRARKHQLPSSSSRSYLSDHRGCTTREKPRSSMSTFKTYAPSGVGNGHAQGSTARTSDTGNAGGRPQLPPLMKTRALTADQLVRPSLPPLTGPVRSTRSASLSWPRYVSEHRSSPYLVPEPAHRPHNYGRATASSPVASRGTGNVVAWSPSSHAPRTPTSSVRSTSLAISPEDATSWPDSLIASPYRSAGSYFELRPEHAAEHQSAGLAPTQHAGGHAFSAWNALGLTDDASPFPSAIFHQDASRAAQPPTREAGEELFAYRDGFRQPFPRPDPATELVPQTPAPTSPRDDPLPQLSLAHRHSLDDQDQLLTRQLPALSLYTPAQRQPVTPDEGRALAKSRDSDFLYKMPILRNMSPLPDMSSESEDDDVENESPGAGPGNGLSRSSEETPASSDDQDIADVPREGSTGEIFKETKSLLPLVSEPDDTGEGKRLFCKLDCTTHQCFSIVDGKWACYRRNYLKVDVVFHLEDEEGKRHDAPKGDLICHAEDGDSFAVERFAVHMSAHVLTKEGNLLRGRQGLVPLIQFGPARERGPRDAVQPVALSSGGSLTGDASANEQMASRIGDMAAFRRVQIRSATLNNGQRGSAGQQFYALKLTLLAYARHGPLTASAGVEVASITSHPITVRGRSKVHYAPAPAAALRKRSQARKTTSAQKARKEAQKGTEAGSQTAAFGAWSQHGAGGLGLGRAAGEGRRSVRLVRAAAPRREAAGASAVHAAASVSPRASRIMDISSIV